MFLIWVFFWRFSVAINIVCVSTTKLSIIELKTYPKCGKSKYNNKEVEEVAKEHVGVYVGGNARARRQHALEEAVRRPQVTLYSVQNKELFNVVLNI